MKNQIGIDTQEAQALAKMLNQLLANYEIYYQNLRGFHWTVQGETFFELHEKFEELYTEANDAIDEIAERILTLGHTPFHSFEEFLENAQLKSAVNVASGREMVETVVENLSALVTAERQILSLSAKNDDEGTNTLMSDYIKVQEKTIWMFNAYLKKAKA